MYTRKNIAEGIVNHLVGRIISKDSEGIIKRMMEYMLSQSNAFLAEEFYKAHGVHVRIAMSDLFIEY